MAYPIPASRVRIEIEVVNSRFIASAGPAFTVDEAKEFINDVKKEFSDASHHVPVYLIGHGTSVIAHCSDAGEPPGTAGRPALAVLQGSGLGDVVVVITRYFGGTKLGTGGLVHAYGDAMKAVLSELPRAQKIPTVVLMLAFPYRLFERIRLLATGQRGEILDQDFGVDITLTVRLPEDELASFQTALNELSNGQIKGEVIERNPATIFPI